MSTRQLERLFRRYLNRSPKRYYMELRLQKARNLLMQTDMSVINVALACGFASPSHFSKCYRAITTPRPTASVAPKGRACRELQAVDLNAKPDGDHGRKMRKTAPSSTDRNQIDPSGASSTSRTRRVSADLIRSSAYPRSGSSRPR